MGLLHQVRTWCLSLSSRARKWTSLSYCCVAYILLQSEAVRTDWVPDRRVKLDQGKVSNFGWEIVHVLRYALEMDVALRIIALLWECRSVALACRISQDFKHAQDCCKKNFVPRSCTFFV